jgi:uncharacterized membrane protein
MANGKGRTAARSARTTAAVKATPTSRRVTRQAKAPEPEPIEDDLVEEAEERRPAGQPAWLQYLTLVLAVIGLGISAYESWVHYHGNHLAGCPTGGGLVNCAAVITSPQSMVFNVIPVAILGLAFYVAAVVLFSPWAWNLRWPPLHWLRLASVIVGMGFVTYLISAEVAIGSICEYCTGVHVVTFLLFCITVFSIAIWGVSGRPAEAETLD